MSNMALAAAREARENPKQVHLKVYKLVEDAHLPVFARDGDACADLYSIEDAWIWPNEVKMIHTGLVFIIPRGHEVQVRSRSSIPLKTGLIIANGIGTIDEHYNDEVMVLFANISGKKQKIEKDSRIAQIAVRPVPRVIVEEADLEQYQSAREESRGGGLGSTGDKEVKQK